MGKLLGLLAALATSTALIAVPAPSAQATWGCVSAGEFRGTRVNTTLLTLEYRYETNGRLVGQGQGLKFKSYRACYGGYDARVHITYRHHHDAWRVDGKWYENP